ncbi:MAG: histidine phosphatase family protein [Proteobacteria bacterium]|nr:histidine phosphatase family protein [Pseudomonadota bacterium]
MTGCHRRHLILLLGAVPLLGRAQAPAASPEALRAALKAGGLTVFIRHAATTWSGYDQLEWPRERQRLLTPQGEAQARQIGAAFTRLELPVGEVLASPFHRCLDTARIAFGRVTAEPRLLGLESDDRDAEARRAYIQALAAEVAPGGKNRIVVSHQSNVAAATGYRPGDGGAAITQAVGGKPQVLARLTPEAWATL